MKTKTLIGLAAIGIAALCVTPAEAGVSVHVSIGLPVLLPPPVVVHPPPCPPRVVVVEPCPAPVVVVEPPPCRPVIWMPPGHLKHHGRLYRSPGSWAGGWHGHR